MTSHFSDPSDSMPHSTFEAPGDDVATLLDKHPALQPPTAKWHLGFDTLNGLGGGALALLLLLVRTETFWFALGLDLKADPSMRFLGEIWAPFLCAFLTIFMTLVMRAIRFPGLDYLNAGTDGKHGVPATATLATLLAALGWITYAFARSPFMDEAFGPWHLPLAGFTAVWLLTVPASLLFKRLLSKA